MMEVQSEEDEHAVALKDLPLDVKKSIDDEVAKRFGKVTFVRRPSPAREQAVHSTYERIRREVTAEKTGIPMKTLERQRRKKQALQSVKEDVRQALEAAVYSGGLKEALGATHQESEVRRGSQEVIPPSSARSSGSDPTSKPSPRERDSSKKVVLTEAKQGQEVSEKDRKRGVMAPKELQEVWSKKPRTAGQRAVEHSLAAAASDELRYQEGSQEGFANLVEKEAEKSTEGGLRNLEKQVKTISSAATASVALRKRAGRDDECEDEAHVYGKTITSEFPEAQQRLEAAEGVNPASSSRDSRFDAGVRAGVSVRALKKQERSRMRASSHREKEKVELAKKRLARQADRLAQEEEEEEEPSPTKEKENEELDDGDDDVRQGRPKSAGRPKRSPPAEWEVDDGLDELEYEYGSWICRWCKSVNTPKASICESYYKGRKCTGTFDESEEWARSRPKPQPQEKRVKRTRLEELLSKDSWYCERCKAGNLTYRVKCFRCSLARPEPQRDVSSGSEDEYRPKRTAATEAATEDFMRSLGLRRTRKRGKQTVD